MNKYWKCEYDFNLDIPFSSTKNVKIPFFDDDNVVWWCTMHHMASGHDDDDDDNDNDNDDDDDNDNNNDNVNNNVCLLTLLKSNQK